MSRQSIILAAHEARRLQLGAGGSVLAVRPVEPQPVVGRDPLEGLACFVIEESRHTHRFLGLKDFAEAFCPYPLGARLAVRETWDYADCSTQTKPVIAYKTGGGAVVTDPDWRSASTMPLRYSRATVEVVRVECRRVCEITSEKALAAGMNRTTMSSLANNCVLWSWETYPTPNVYTFADLAFKGWWDQRFGARYPWAESWAWFLTLDRRGTE